jgi:hypothetical protein
MSTQLIFVLVEIHLKLKKAFVQFFNIQET